ncbi:MAG: hypothetical protein AAGB00_12260 [Planctomycetota bacterium]
MARYASDCQSAPTVLPRSCCVAAAVLFAAASPLAAQSMSPAAGAAAPADVAALQSLVTDLALQIQLTTRGQATVRGARYGQLAAALASWNASRQSTADAVHMERWLRSAIRASMPGSATPMPAPPIFSAKPEAPAASPTPTASASGDAAESLPSPKTLPAAIADATPASVAPTPRRPVGVASEPTAVDDLFSDLAPSNEQTSELDASIGGLSEPEGPTADKRDPLALEAHPASAGLAWGDPFVDDEPAPVTADEPAGRTVRMKPATAPQVAIDYAELAARATGYRRGLDFVEAELIAKPDASAFQLAGLARELESLQAERALIELYAAGAPREQRGKIGELPEAMGVIKMLKSHAADRSKRVANVASRGADAERAILAGLTRKIDELRGGQDW